MRIIRNEKQKDNLAKVFWDMGKIVIAILVFSPLAKPEIIIPGSLLSGLLIGFSSWFVAYLLDGMEVKL